jgi:hypothetical protein
MTSKKYKRSIIRKQAAKASEVDLLVPAHPALVLHSFGLRLFDLTSLGKLNHVWLAAFLIYAHFVRHVTRA